MNSVFVRHLFWMWKITKCEFYEMLLLLCCTYNNWSLGVTSGTTVLSLHTGTCKYSCDPLWCLVFIWVLHIWMSHQPTRFPGKAFPFSRQGKARSTSLTVYATSQRVHWISVCLNLCYFLGGSIFFIFVVVFVSLFDFDINPEWFGWIKRKKEEIPVFALQERIVSGFYSRSPSVHTWKLVGVDVWTLFPLQQNSVVQSIHHQIPHHCKTFTAKQ